MYPSTLMMFSGTFENNENKIKAAKKTEKGALPTEEKRITAHDLFSLFTANIIKKKVRFTR